MDSIKIINELFNRATGQEAQADIENPSDKLMETYFRRRLEMFARHDVDSSIHEAWLDAQASEC